MFYLTVDFLFFGYKDMRGFAFNKKQEFLFQIKDNYGEVLLPVKFFFYEDIKPLKHIFPIAASTLLLQQYNRFSILQVISIFVFICYLYQVYHTFLLHKYVIRVQNMHEKLPHLSTLTC